MLDPRTKIFWQKNSDFSLKKTDDEKPFFDRFRSNGESTALSRLVFCAAVPLQASPSRQERSNKLRRFKLFFFY
jgi:hypothetical protein